MTVIDVFDIWQKLMSFCNVQQNGQIRPQTDFQNWYNACNTEMFKHKIAKFQLGQQVTDELAPFHSTVIISTSAVPGRNYVVAPYPGDYENLISVRIIRQKIEATCEELQPWPLIDGSGKAKMYTDPDYAQFSQQFANMGLIENEVYVVDADKWGGCLAHKTKGPSWQNPKATQDSAGIKIAPKGVQGIVLDYFHTPRSAVFAYTIGTGDIVVYNAAGSTQLEWTSVIENEFLLRLGMKYAGAIGDMQLYQQFENDLKILL